MANVLTPKHMLDQAIITHSDVNTIFTDLEDNTDGTTSKIDTTNLRTGAIDREHLSDNIFIGGATNAANTTTGDFFSTSSTDTGAPIVATTVREVTGLSGTTISQGEVIRYCGDAMVRGGPQAASVSFANATARVEQQAYLSVWFKFSPTNGDPDYWLSTKNFGWSITNGPYSYTSAGDYTSIDWTHGTPGLTNLYLRQTISGAFIFPAAQDATIEKIVLKCHVENTSNTVYLASTKVYGMVQRN